MKKYDVSNCISCGVLVENKELNSNGWLCNGCKKETEAILEEE